MAIEINSLMSFLDSATTAWQATDLLKQELTKAGFIELFEDMNWQLEESGRYFVCRNNSSLIAFVMPEIISKESSFRIVASHTDSPSLRVKMQGESSVGGCTRNSVEVYGGPITSTWLDRPLNLAGRVMLRTEDGIEERLINFEQPIAIIPNLSIHLNRNVNNGFEYNAQEHLQIVIGQQNEEVAGERVLATAIANNLSCDLNDILDYELNAVPLIPSALVGVNEEFICSGRIDNLMACHSTLLAIKNYVPDEGDHVAVAMFFDNEEVGSSMPAGANSNFASVILERIVLAGGSTREDFLCSLARSFLVSHDGAHAVHPNFSEKHDRNYMPVVNGGPVIKQNSNHRYITTSYSTALIEELCRREAITVQRMMNRSDVPSGSTVGPSLASLLGVAGIDLGFPMLAMHSSYETAGVKDYKPMIQLLSIFYAIDNLDF